MARKNQVEEVVEKEAPYGERLDVHVGDVVLWHDSQEAEPTGMAFVTAVGSDSISVAIMPTGYSNCFTREGVRHVSDPRRKLIAEAGEGVWSHRPAEVARRELLASLVERVEALETALTKPG